MINTSTNSSSNSRATLVPRILWVKLQLQLRSFNWVDHVISFIPFINQYLSFKCMIPSMLWFVSYKINVIKLFLCTVVSQWPVFNNPEIVLYHLLGLCQWSISISVWKSRRENEVDISVVWSWWWWDHNKRGQASDDLLIIVDCHVVFIVMVSLVILWLLKGELCYMFFLICSLSDRGKNISSRTRRLSC